MPGMKELIDKLRDEKPECPICHDPVYPEHPSGAHIIYVPSKWVPDVLHLLPVHEGACRAEAEDRARRGQEAVNERTARTNRLADLARRHAEGEDLGPEVADLN